MSSSHSTVTYTSESDVDGSPWGIHMMTGYEYKASKAAPRSPKHAPPSPVYASDSPEHAPPSDDNLEPTEDQALPAPVSPSPLSPYYSTNSQHIEDDPQEADPEDVPEEDPFEDEDEEVEELLALAASILAVPDPTLPYKDETEPFEEDEVTPTSPSHTSPSVTPLSQTRLRRMRKSVRPHHLLSLGTMADNVALVASPPLLLSPLAETLFPRLICHLGRELDFSLHPIYLRLERALKLLLLDCVGLLWPPREGMRILRTKTVTAEQEVADSRDAWSFAMDRIRALKYKIQESDDRLTRFGEQNATKKNGVSAAAIEQLINQRVADALLTHEANRNKDNGNGCHDSGGGSRRSLHTAHGCTYKEFLNCKPLNFKGTEGAVGLAYWFENMEFVFHIGNCVVECQVKYATCTLLRGILTWWNFHARTVRHDAAYEMTWKNLIKMITEAYCPRNEIQKLENELWNLTAKGTDLVGYTQCFQELALLCSRMLLEETDKVERFIWGLPDRIREM
ncbi:reverse transcriptase domain-containing protein [Tanacetum coccineum]